MSLKLLLLVAGAGAVGSTLRYLVNLAFLRRGTWELPYATLTVNVLGCFLAGIFYALFADKLHRHAAYAAGAAGRFSRRLHDILNLRTGEREPHAGGSAVEGAAEHRAPESFGAGGSLLRALAGAAILPLMRFRKRKP